MLLDGTKRSGRAVALAAVGFLAAALLAAAMVAASEARAAIQLVVPKTITAQQPLEAEVATDSSLEKVSFFVDGRARGVDRRPAWRLPRQGGQRKLKTGRHSISVRVRRGGQTFTQTRSVEVVPASASDASNPAPVASSHAPSPKPTPTSPAPTVPPASPPPAAPPTAPASGTTPTSGDTLFASDFSQNLRGWSLGGVGDVIPQVVSGPEGPYCEFTLTGTQGRSELIMGDDLHILDGETVLYEFEEFIVPGFAYGSRSLGWNLFTQFKSDGEGSPMLALDLWDEGGKKGLWVEPEPGPNYYVAPMAEGVWHKISMLITASSSGNGGWVLSLDGEEIDRQSGMSTIRPGKAFAYIKNGLYRSGPTINATSKLRLRNVSLTLQS